MTSSVVGGSGPSHGRRGEAAICSARCVKPLGELLSFLAGKVGGNDVVLACPWLGLDQAPVPAAVASAVDEHERGHPFSALTRRAGPHTVVGEFEIELPVAAVRRR